MADDETVAVCFIFKIDNEDLGSFSGCDGLGCEFVMETREEGGNNGVIWQLPTRLKYSNVKLTRAVTKDSTKIMNWFAGQAKGIKRKTATIQALALDNTIIAQWSLADVVPVKWTGPQLTTDSNKVATETVEFAHHGFLAG